EEVFTAAIRYGEDDGDAFAPAARFPAEHAPQVCSPTTNSVNERASLLPPMVLSVPDGWRPSLVSWEGGETIKYLHATRADLTSLLDEWDNWQPASDEPFSLI